MTILDTIVANKREEVAAAKKAVSVKTLERAPQRQTFSLKTFLADPTKTGIIAEFKRKSPSKGVFLEGADAAAITKAYTENGASGLSVLTDNKFFGGSPEDLKAARVNAIPILRKDFMIDEYQVIEARALGADVILLIAACLTPKQVQTLGKLAHSLNLEVLLELHAEDELDHVCPEIDLVGINNRDLKTFQVDIDRSVRLADRLPGDMPRIAESGISHPETIQQMRAHGFTGFLIGETFMREPDPGAAFHNFVAQLKPHAPQSL
ncbi:MAG TPA: indole-3-glycerol phosphate synthase TrpC [Dinghuibacter sp.]|jgi:indole-3-glycerol phosphate synthase|uniref:indole-3-glycerol phosphate synthase TrpC n=1 Tax=Dinghuibacter sp. TaxID=2024697 RepID=UPI002C7DF5FE|nr:indole-3-glycerol phosphate synthase TrpC [Dinghuibacter sp.]HTJ13757.1 indole-3-glycerol phosphate synthase TrpC [Dinghuibacter sp.]